MFPVFKWSVFRYLLYKILYFKKTIKICKWFVNFLIAWKKWFKVYLVLSSKKSTKNGKIRQSISRNLNYKLVEPLVSRVSPIWKYLLITSPVLYISFMILDHVIHPLNKEIIQSIHFRNFYSFPKFRGVHFWAKQASTTIRETLHKSLSEKCRIWNVNLT